MSKRVEASKLNNVRMKTVEGVVVDEERVKAIMQAAQIPAVSYAVSTKEGGIEAGAMGNTCREGRNSESEDVSHPVTKDTVFQAASLSKPVFAYIFLKLAKEYNIGLDSPLCELSKNGFGNPNGDYQKDNKIQLLTPRLILSHQASLPNEGPDHFLESTPGQSFDYSGLAYCMLSEVLQEITGKPLEVLAQQIFAGIGMTRTSFLKHQDNSVNRVMRAIGHDINGEPNSRSENFMREHPAASLITTADDYQRFILRCSTDVDVRDDMFEPQLALTDKDHTATEKDVPPEVLSKLSWGLGIGIVQNKDGERIAFHWGDINVSRAFMACNLDTGAAVSCFTNSAYGPKVFASVTEPVGDLSEV